MKNSHKPRVAVSTDIGGNDPDDFQSMVHLLVYTDLFRIEALISSPPYAGRKKDILSVIEAYEQDYPTLNAWGDYPEPDALHLVTAQGEIETGEPASGKETEGSRLLIDRARHEDSDPLWVLVWGSMTDVAQALYEAPEITKAIRVYSIGSWNTDQDPEARDYVWNNHPDLWWIENDFTFRGMYQEGKNDGDLSNDTFVARHVKGHGALGDLLFSKKADLKMGDTPSVLYLLSPLVGNVGDWNDPAAPGWGGSFRKDPHGPNYWTDIEENVEGSRGSVNRWRESYLRDWQKRMDRCLVRR